MGREQISLVPFPPVEGKIAAMNTTMKLPESDPIVERLEDQLAWYARTSMANQRFYKLSLASTSFGLENVFVVYENLITANTVNSPSTQSSPLLHCTCPGRPRVRPRPYL